jgi:hypothetical protein
MDSLGGFKEEEKDGNCPNLKALLQVKEANLIERSIKYCKLIVFVLYLLRRVFSFMVI